MRPNLISNFVNLWQFSKTRCIKTNNMASKILELIDSLPNSGDKDATLNDIKICLISLNKDLLKQAVPNVSFDVIFNCLQTEKM